MTERLTINSVVEMDQAQRDALTDAQIMDLAYGIDYYDPWMSNGAQEAKRQTQIIDNELAPRLAAIKAARAQARTPRKHDYPNGRTLDCGCTIYDTHEVMSTQNGTSCADCYDQMSY